MEPDSIRIGNLIHTDRTIQVERKYKFSNDKELLEIFDYLESKGFTRISARLDEMVVLCSNYEDYFEFIEKNPLLATDVDFTGGEEE